MAIRRRIRKAVSAGIAAVLPFMPLTRGKMPPPPVRPKPERPGYETRVERPEGGERLLQQRPVARGTQRSPIFGLGARGGKPQIPREQRTVRTKRVEGRRVGPQPPPPRAKPRMRRGQHRPRKKSLTR